MTVKTAQKRKEKPLEVIFLLLVQCTQVQRINMYIQQERKQGCCSSPSSSLSTPEKNIVRKQHELQVMASVYSFLTPHLMPAKLIPRFQQLEYILHHLQLNLHAPEHLASCRHASQQIEEDIWCQQKSQYEGSRGCTAGKAWPEQDHEPRLGHGCSQDKWQSLPSDCPQ